MSRTDNQIEWHMLLKSLPAVKAAWKDRSLQDPMLKVFGEQMNDAQSPPTIPEWEQVAEAIDTRMEAIILGQSILDGSTRASLSNLENEIKNIVFQRDFQKMSSLKTAR